MPDKLEKLKEMLKLLQDDTVKPSTIKQFLELVLNTIKKSKENFESLSKKNLQEIDNALQRISTEHSDVLDRVSSEVTSTKKAVKTELNKSIKEMREMCEELLLRKPVDGKDADEESIVNSVLEKIVLPEYELFSLTDKGEQIVREINELPTDDEDLKIDAKHIKNLPKSSNGTGVGIVGARNLYQLSDVTITAPSQGQALVWNGLNWVNDNVSGSGGGSTWFFDQTPTDGGTYTLLQGSIDGANQTFIVSEGQYISGLLIPMLNGVPLNQGTGSSEFEEGDFSIGSFTLNTAPSGTDKVSAFYTTTAGGGGGNAAGADTQVQFNDAGALNGDTTFTFNKTTNVLTAATIVVDDAAYGVGWNGSLQVPTKNALYDKIESIVSTPGGSDTQLQYNNAGSFDGISYATFDGSTLNITSAVLHFKNDATTGMRFITSGITGGNIRDYIAPNSNGTLALLDFAQTFTNKTLSTGIDVSASLSWGDGVKQTFNPNATNAGINVGAVAGDPSAPANGDLWYDSSANELTARINGANVALGAGGGSGITIGTTTITSGTDTRILYDNAGVVGEYTISGTGNVAMTSSPVFTTPNIGLANTNDGVKFGTNTGAVFYSDSGFTTPLGSLLFSSDGVFSLDSGTGGHNARFDFTGVTGTKTYTLPDTTGTVALTSVDTLASLTSIQGVTVTLADAGADAILGWDDSAGAYENLTQAEVLAVIGDALDTAKGVVELAIASEVTTGTDTTRAVTADAFSGSDYGKRVVNILVSDPTGSAITTGDGKACFRVPSVMNGWNLVGVAGSLSTVSSSGLPTFQVRRSRRSTATTRSDADMLSTKLSIDASEFDSVDATTAVVIDGSNDDVNTGDNIYIDIDVAGTGAKGLVAELIFQLP